MECETLELIRWRKLLGNQYAYDYLSLSWVPLESCISLIHVSGGATEVEFCHYCAWRCCLLNFTQWNHIYHDNVLTWSHVSWAPHFVMVLDCRVLFCLVILWLLLLFFFSVSSQSFISGIQSNPDPRTQAGQPVVPYFGLTWWLLKLFILNIICF